MNVRLLNGFCLAVAAMVVVPYASASSIIFERDLPNTSNGGTTYVNSAIGSDRANVMWLSGQPDSGAYDIVGDTLNFAGNVHVTTFTIYEVANNTVANVTNSAPNQEFSSISLYMSPSGGTPSSLNSVSSSYIFQRAYYPNPNTDYVDGITGHTFPLYAITFTLNQDFLAGIYGFAVDAVSNTSNPGYSAGGTYGLYLAASNAALSTASGATEQGADGGFYYYQEPVAGQPTVTALSPECLPGVAGNPCETSWDKGSDINVLVAGTAGTATPEPATFGFVGLALAGVWLRRRRQ